jgi:hypothetical protein
MRLNWYLYLLYCVRKKDKFKEIQRTIFFFFFFGSFQKRSALAKFQEIFALHLLVFVVLIIIEQHELPCLEVRIAEGYGARWLADGAQFRGFLEPQMEG